MSYLTLVPFAFYYYVRKQTVETLESEAFQTRCGALYTDLKFTQGALFQVFWYMFRRLLFTLTIVFLDFSPILQALIIVFSSYLSLIYL